MPANHSDSQFHSPEHVIDDDGDTTGMQTQRRVATGEVAGATVVKVKAGGERSQGSVIPYRPARLDARSGDTVGGYHA